jgi:3-phosphoshikimate 1-carboxyvinyltransferase
MTRSACYREIGGRVAAPPSKSSMQRAVACALLAGGESAGSESLLRSPSSSADCLAALGLARALGASVEERGGSMAVGGALRGGPPSAGTRRLSCGESGLCIRMFSPIAALFPGESLLEAEGSLRSRGVGMIEPSLRELGAFCETSSGLPPVRVRGPLLGGRARVDGHASSQLLTGLLIALPLAEGDSLLEVEGLASRGYVDLSLATMRAFGVEAERDEAFTLFRVPSGQRYRPAEVAIEGDWSGAAFLLVAAALAAIETPLEVAGLDASSPQPDRAVLDALRAAGARVEILPAGLRIARARLQAFEFDASSCPDLFPPLVALAAACEGTSKIKGVGRLRGKESDRAAALTEEFGAFGAMVGIEGDEMIVRGIGFAAGRRLAGGRVDSRGDHRIAMAAAIASLYCASQVEILGSECVAKSWPTFFEDLAAIAR